MNRGGMMTISQLVPSVDKRISAWMEIQKRRELQDLQHKPVPTSITISREFGCEAYPLASALKSSLDEQNGSRWTVFDEEMINQITASDDMSGFLTERLGERSRYLEYIISTLLPYWKSQEQVYRPIVETVFSLARQGNAIIVGQGAFAIARDLSNCYHFRLIAPTSFRAESYAGRTGMSVDAAEKLIQEKESARTTFISNFLNCDFEPDNFHLLLNNSKVPVDEMVKLILAFIST